MKNNFFLLLIVVFAGITGCEKENPAEINDRHVEKYIELLKTEQYYHSRLPDFTWEAIPALLQYRNDTELIKNYPRNPVSSYMGGECSLGMLVLWTIESIRAKAINSKYLVMGFPSQNPILLLRHADEFEPVFDDRAHMVAAKAYFDWWYNNNHKDFDDFKFIDPLKDTDYSWN